MAGDHPGTADYEGAGWRVELGPAGEQLTVEHPESGRAFVLDADGGLTVPGEGAVGADLSALQSTLSAALEGEVEDGPGHGDGQAATNDDEAANCTIECDESTGEITLSSSSKIELDAPSVDVTADGVLTLEGSLITLN
jgi:hypothetical protein